MSGSTNDDMDVQGTSVVCPICPHACRVPPGGLGLCGARRNENGAVADYNYGKVTAMALDPIEKKPLAMFAPGKKVLSVGSFGCNLKCPFCQNSDISMAGDSIPTTLITPEDLAQKSLDLAPCGNIGVAYTYNEPLIGFEYVRDCARLVKDAGQKNVVVTNGYVNEAPLMELVRYIDALNIDLKAFSDEFYKRVGGDLQTVQRTIEVCDAHCHVEVTTLIIPGENDAESEMRELSTWLAGVNRDIPLHITRFFPRYRYGGREATHVDALRRLADIARESLAHVFMGNC